MLRGSDSHRGHGLDRECMSREAVSAGTLYQKGVRMTGRADTILDLYYLVVRLQASS